MAKRVRTTKISTKVKELNLSEWLLAGELGAGIWELLLLPAVASGLTLILGETAGDSEGLIGRVLVSSLS